MIVLKPIDPVVFSIGPLTLTWYALMYLFGFFCTYYLCVRRIKNSNIDWTKEQVKELILNCALGLILGARAGYVFFYQFERFLSNPTYLFKMWEGGMSFHGGMIGVALAGLLFCRRYKKNFFDVVDFIAPAAPLGLALGRLGNFINAELYGRIADVPWAMIFPGSDGQPRHPSQLYQMALEGLLLFCILQWWIRKPRPRMSIIGLFLLGYGSLRLVTEFFREPDAHLGFIAFNWMTMGQLLCLPMIILGGAFIFWAYKSNKYAPTRTTAKAEIAVKNEKTNKRKKKRKNPNNSY